MSLKESLRKILLKRFPKPYAIILYGSVVYGKKNPSDIDVMVIGDYSTGYSPFKMERVTINAFLLNEGEIGKSYYPLFVFPYEILYLKENFKDRLELLVKSSVYAVGSYYFKGLSEEKGNYRIRRENFLEILQILESVTSGYLNYNIKSSMLPEYTLKILPYTLYYNEFKCNLIARAFKICFGNVSRKARSLIELSERNPTRMFKLVIYNMIKFFSAMYSISRGKIRRDSDFLIKALYFVKRRI